jgi:hypothetical protein
MELLDRIVAQEEAREEASGLAQAKRDCQEGMKADDDAFDAVCSYRCRSIEETRIKAQYLLTTAMTWEDDAKALLKSQGGSLNNTPALTFPHSV